jgi:hypothetical protein
MELVKPTEKVETVAPTFETIPKSQPLLNTLIFDTNFVLPQEPLNPVTPAVDLIFRGKLTDNGICTSIPAADSYQLFFGPQEQKHDGE